MAKNADADGNEIVETEPVVKPTPVVPDPEPEEKLTLSPSELDAMVSQKVAAAQKENEERVRREEAALQGNYKLLAETAEAELRKTNLSLWRTKAASKYKLSDNFIDTLSGDSEEEIMGSAKKLKKFIDDEVSAKLAMEKEENIPPYSKETGRNHAPKDTSVNHLATTRAIIANDLGLGSKSYRH